VGLAGQRVLNRVHVPLSRSNDDVRRTLYRYKARKKRTLDDNESEESMFKADAKRINGSGCFLRDDG
jgi:hypothetical protein